MHIILQRAEVSYSKHTHTFTLSATNTHRTQPDGAKTQGGHLRGWQCEFERDIYIENFSLGQKQRAAAYMALW